MPESCAHNANLITVRERMLSLGSTTLSTSELIALVVGTGHVNGATELAERLYAECGGLMGIARLGLVELSQARGMGMAKATQLHAALDLGERLKQEIVVCERPQIRSPADAAALCLPEMALLEQEQMRSMLLDNRNRVVAIQDVYRGNYNSVGIHPGDIFKEAVRRNCATIIVAHNHPSGDPAPSTEDVRATKMLVDAGKILDIQVLDHIIVGSGGHFVSLKERGLGFD